MSGHSKWSTIKHAKAITDQKRGKLFTKFAREIIIAARQGGGGNPEANFRLRIAIQKAKDNNVPSDNIERAIKRGSGEGGGKDLMDEIVFEGYGPGGAAIMLEVLTDNRNRTVPEIRATLIKAGGNLAQAGSVAWQFSQKGIIVAEAEGDKADELALLAIDAGADDFEVVDSIIYIYSTPGKLEDIRNALAGNSATVRSSEISMIPSNPVMLEDKAALQMLKLLDRLEELDDVQRVFSNADFPDQVLEQYRNEA